MMGKIFQNMNSYEIPLKFLWNFQKRIENLGRLGMLVVSVSLTISSLVAAANSNAIRNTSTWVPNGQPCIQLVNASGHLGA